MLAAAFRNFKHPKPTKRLVLDCASLFTHHVQRSLVAGTIRKNALTIDMPTDVFKFLFDGKGVDVGRGYKEYSLEDFDPKVFLEEWYLHKDRNGDGCAVDFPVRMKSSISWARCRGGTETKGSKRRFFFERVYMYVVKKRI